MSPPALPSLVVVTGPRVLYQQPDPKAWLRAQLDELNPDVVVTGDARGPDDWGFLWMHERRGLLRMRGETALPIARRYTLAGLILDTDLTTVGAWTSANPPEPDAGAALWAAWCLHRDRVMVRHVVRRRSLYTVTVVALGTVDWSRTRGTAFTVERARYQRLALRDSWWRRSPSGQAEQTDAPARGWSYAYQS